MLSMEQKIINGDYDNKLDYKADKAAYCEEERRLEIEFSHDLAKELSLWGVPDKYCAPSVAYAWSEGHSSGYHEVYNYAREITERIFNV